MYGLKPVPFEQGFGEGFAARLKSGPVTRLVSVRSLVHKGLP